MNKPIAQNDSLALRQLHQLYCQRTAQNLTLRFDRERLWYEFQRAGFSAAELEQVIAYLQKEIRAQRRNIGALKLSNLLQLDRFEEDLNISRVLLKNSAPRPEPKPKPDPSTATDEAQTSRILQQLRSLRHQLRRPS